jgi:hypothetical protein
MALVNAEKLTAAQCARAMRDGDFGDDVRGAAELVAVVLTQGWCPQWKMMASWLDAAAGAAGARVFFVEYDREDFFEPFMAWKEDVLGNRSVPYVRYYRGGALVAESNYLSRDGFLANFRRGAPGTKA